MQVIELLRLNPLEKEGEIFMASFDQRNGEDVRMNAPQIFRRTAPWTRYALVSAAVSWLFVTGCATTGSYDEESDLPWNTPQPWEGSPSIPGFENR